MPTGDVSIRSVPGGIFWSAVLAVVLYVIGFITNGWERWNNNWSGLWSTCIMYGRPYAEDWFKATQAMITIGLILIVISLGLIFVYMFVESVSVDRRTLMKAFAAVTLLAVACMLVGFIIFGVKHSRQLQWSFALSVVGSGFGLIAASLSIVHLRR